MRSLRWRIGAWTVGTFAAVLTAFTAAGIRDDRERMLALERATARSLTEHLVAMPELSGNMGEAAERLAPIQSALASTGSVLELLPASVPRAQDVVYLSVRPLSLAEGDFELRYRVGSDRFAAWMRRTIAIHALYGLVAVGLTLVGVAWILRRNLVEPLRAMSLQVRHMVRGVGWEPRIPPADTEVRELAAALRELGPAMEEQVGSWIEAERRAAVARALSDLRTRIFEHQRRALAALGNLEAAGLVQAAGKPKLRAAIADVERVWIEVRAEEYLHFGSVARRAGVAPLPTVGRT